MRRIIITIALIPSLALAQTATTYNYNTVTSSTGTATNNNNNVSTNTNINQNVNSGTVTNVNQNTSASTATNTNINTDTSNSTVNQTVNSTTNSTNRNINTDTSTSTVSQTVNASNQNVNVNDSKSTSYSASDTTQTINQHLYSPPPSAIAPSMMSYSQDLCTTGMSGAVQTQILGLSAGKTVRDQNCERLKLSKTLFDMGMRVASVSLLCQDIRVFEAMAEAGTPCPYQGQIGDKAKAAWAANPDKKPKK
jgi:hypothetical protein